MKNLSSHPRSAPHSKPRTTGAAPIPPDTGNGRDGNFPYDILRKSICLANAISLAASNCNACETPEACETVAGEVMVFIDDLHRHERPEKS